MEGVEIVVHRGSRRRRKGKGGDFGGKVEEKRRVLV